MTSQGSAHGRFQRALERRNVDQAEMAARELGRLSLMDALSLVVLYARVSSPKFEPAAPTRREFKLRCRLTVRYSETDTALKTAPRQATVSAATLMISLSRQPSERTYWRTASCAVLASWREMRRPADRTS